MDDHPHAGASLATFVALLLLCLGIFLWMCAPYLLPVFMGEVLALLMLPLYLALKRRIPRPLASLISILAVLILVITPIALIVSAGVCEGSAPGARAFQPQRSHGASRRLKSSAGRGDSSAMPKRLRNS